MSPWHAACEDLTLMPLITLAPKQKKQSNNKVYAGVREMEKCQVNVPMAPGFVLITAIIVILL